MRIAWVSTWSRACGIADYSKALWPSLETSLRRAGGSGTVVSLDEFPAPAKLAQRLRELSPDVIHFQHEYGIWGGKNPPFYQFPSIVSRVREALPRARLAATAHTVIPPDYRFKLEDSGLGRPVRLFANRFLLGRLGSLWGRRTWGALDGVVIHSRHQLGWVQKAGARSVEVIPHLVPLAGVKGAVARSAVVRPTANGEGRARTLLVFGFFSPDKGQDLAIEALRRMPPDVSLVLAGGVRDGHYRAYFDRCRELARAPELAGRVRITGFVEARAIESLYAKASLVIVPFRETTGSGSLAQAFARGAPVLASDHPINREIAERVPGSLEFFRSGDAEDLARRALALLEDAASLERLREASRRYAELCAPWEISERHLGFYRTLMEPLSERPVEAAP